MSWIGDEFRKLNTESMEELTGFLLKQDKIDKDTPFEEAHKNIKASGYSPLDRFKENCKILEQKYGVGVSVDGEYLVIEAVKGISPSQISDRIEKELQKQLSKLEKGYQIADGVTVESEGENVRKINCILGISEKRYTETGRWLWKKKDKKLKPMILIHENQFLYNVNCLDKPELRETIDFLAINLYGLLPKK